MSTPVCLLFVTAVIVVVKSGFVRDIPGLNKNWEELYAKSDWKGLADLYWTDCAIMPQNAPTLFGHEGVINIFKAAKQSGIETIELHIGFSKQITFDNGIDRGRYIFLNKENIIIDEGKYITNWQRFNDKENKHPWKLKSDMFSSNIMMQQSAQNVLNVNENTMNEWSKLFLECFTKFDGIQCRSIVHDDVLLKDLTKDKNYDKDGIVDYFNAKYQISKRQILDRKIEKIAQNKVKISFNGIFEIDNNDKTVTGEIIAWFDIVLGQVWRIDIDYNVEGDKAEL